MATLLDEATDAGAGTGASHTGPCTVHVHGDSVFDGAVVELQSADSDTEAEYVTFKVLNNKQQVTVDIRGTFFLRAFLKRPGAATSISITTTQ